MHAMIVCPPDRGLLHFETVASVYDIQQALLRRGHTYEFSVTAFTEIVAARNHAATRFSIPAPTCSSGSTTTTASARRRSRSCSRRMSASSGCAPRSA